MVSTVRMFGFWPHLLHCYNSDRRGGVHVIGRGLVWRALGGRGCGGRGCGGRWLAVET